MNIVTVKDVVIGEGTPKICAPLVGCQRIDLEYEITLANQKPVDIVEWRVDYFEYVDDVSKVMETLKWMKEQLPVPLLFTFRTQKEGGIHAYTKQQYFRLYQEVIMSKLVDLIDVEWQIGVELVDELVALAHQNQVKVILSHHNFCKTPSKSEMIAIFKEMNETSADIYKLAVMPLKKEDVVCLMETSDEVSKDIVNQPIVALSMGELGQQTRIQAKLFGSSITFGTLKKASAPGQIPVEELYQLLQ